MYGLRLSPALVIGLCVLSLGSSGKAADQPLDPDEQVLQEAHVKTDAASLQAFIQHHTGKDGQKAVPELIKASKNSRPRVRARAVEALYCSSDNP